MSSDADYSTLLDLFIRLVESQAGKKIKSGVEWLNDAQVLATKPFRHLVSMQALAAGATIEHDGIPRVFFVDHASVKVVARAALETYLVFFLPLWQFEPVAMRVQAQDVASWRPSGSPGVPRIHRTGARGLGS